jgi:hypothetical protein
MYERYMIYRAYHCHLHGQPIPVTLFSELVQCGIDPEDIEAAFCEGHEPPFELLEELEEMGTDEEGPFIVVGDERIHIEGIEPDELEDLLRKLDEESDTDE